MNIPFDMQRTGATISRLRRGHGMTQLQLADALGVTFQAVSNWERGLSMPDISKLPELAELFGTTIDGLLGRPCPVLEQAAAGRLDEHLQSTAITVEEAAEAAPLLPPEQAEALAGHVLDDAAQAAVDLCPLLPFMSTRQVDALLQKRLATNDYAPLLPFCSTAAIDAAVQARLASGEAIAPFLPFLSNDALQAAWDTRVAQGRSTTEFLPFLPTETVDRLALECSGRSEGFVHYLPFLSNDALMQLLRQRMERHQSITLLLPFLPESAIRQLAASHTGG